MKKKYIALTMAALMVFGAAGCGKKEKPAETPTATPTAAPTEAPTEAPAAPQMSIYSFDGTNAEKAVTDYLVNNYTREEASSVVIPHMNILKIDNKEATMDIYGAFLICEYTLKNNALSYVGGYNADSMLTLDKNSNGTFTVTNCKEVKDPTNEADLENLCAGDEDLLNNFKDQDKHSLDVEPWPSIRANDLAYYGFDNNLTFKLSDDITYSISRVPSVQFSTSGTKDMYLTQDAYVRTAPNENGLAYYMLLSGAQVTVTGMTETWARVNVEDRTGYVAATALTDTAPSATPTPTLTPTPTPEPTEEELPSVSGTLAELYSDHIIIERGDEYLQYTITGDTYMNMEDIPVDSAVTITYYTDENGQAVATAVEVISTPDEYEEIEVDDDGNIIEEEELEPEVIDENDETYEEVEIE